MTTFLFVDNGCKRSIGWMFDWAYMKRSDGDKAAIFFILALLVVSLGFNLYRSTGSNSNFVGSNEQPNKASRDYCDSKLAALGYNKAANSQAAPDTNKQEERDNLCQQIRTAETAEDATEYTRRQYWLAWVSLGLVGVATVAASAAAYFSWRQAKAAADALVHAQGSAQHAARQANSANEANALLRQSLIAEQRPWIKMEMTPGGGLHHDLNGLNVTVRFKLKNVGRTVATNVFVHPKIFAPAVGIDPPYDPVERQNRAVSEARRLAQSPFGYLVFPGDEIIQDISVSISKDEIKRITKTVNFMQISIVSVASYGFAMGGSVHFTAATIELFRIQSPKGRPPRLIYVTDEIAKEDLGFMRSPIVPGYAD